MRESVLKPGLEIPKPPAGLPACGEPVPARRLRRGARQQVMDFDFIVVGSGFGGSVSAHRLTEKGYRVGVMEMGRRWTPENLPTTNWQIWRLDLAAGPRAARLLQHRSLPPRFDHARLRGGRRVHHLRQYLAGPGRRHLGERIVGGPGGLESRDAAALRHRGAHVGRHREPDHGSGGSTSCSGRRKSTG